VAAPVRCAEQPRAAEHLKNVSRNSSVAGRSIED
jgi:hypothetical protein